METRSRIARIISSHSEDANEWLIEEEVLQEGVGERTARVYQEIADGEPYFAALEAACNMRVSPPWKQHAT